MVRTPGFLQQLRLERKPLAILAGLALAARVLLLSLGVISASDPALAGLGHLCAPSGYSAQTPVSDQEPTADLCLCGVLCAQNTASKLFTHLSDLPVVQAGAVKVAGTLAPPQNHSTFEKPFSHFSIRGPPLAV